MASSTPRDPKTSSVQSLAFPKILARSHIQMQEPVERSMETLSPRGKTSTPAHASVGASINKGTPSATVPTQPVMKLKRNEGVKEPSVPSFHTMVERRPLTARRSEPKVPAMSALKTGSLKFFPMQKNSIIAGIEFPRETSKSPFASPGQRRLSGKLLLQPLSSAPVIPKTSGEGGAGSKSSAISSPTYTDAVTKDPKTASSVSVKLAPLENSPRVIQKNDVDLTDAFSRSSSLRTVTLGPGETQAASRVSASSQATSSNGEFSKVPMPLSPSSSSSPDANGGGGGPGESGPLHRRYSGRDTNAAKTGSFRKS